MALIGAERLGLFIMWGRSYAADEFVAASALIFTCCVRVHYILFSFAILKTSSKIYWPAHILLQFPFPSVFFLFKLFLILLSLCSLLSYLNERTIWISGLWLLLSCRVCLSVPFVSRSELLIRRWALFSFLLSASSRASTCSLLFKSLPHPTTFPCDATCSFSYHSCTFLAQPSSSVSHTPSLFSISLQNITAISFYHNFPSRFLTPIPCSASSYMIL